MSDSSTLGAALLDAFVAQVGRDGIDTATGALGVRLGVADANAVELSQEVVAGLLARGHAGAALSIVEAAIKRFPQVLQLRYLRGNALRLSGQPVAAEGALRSVLEQAAGHREAALSLAYLLREQGLTLAASAVMIASLRARAESIDETSAALVFLRECGSYTQAHALAQQALQRWPAAAQIAALAAEFALMVGEFDNARNCLRTALAGNPDSAASWLRLAYCQRYVRRDDPDLLRIEGAWQNSALGIHARTAAGFALGKGLDDLGDYAAAANVLRQANAMASGQVSWRTKNWRQFVTTRLGAASLPSVDVDDDFTPVFVVGLPRTGTTLATTLLARSEHVRERGELNWIHGMFELLAAQDRLHDPAALAKVAQLVAAQMRRDDAPARIYLDKNPLNFRYLDLIAALFPRARIIHCRRQPRDTALSLWMQHFIHADLGFAYDFATIAQFAQGYRELFAHWRSTLTLPIFDLDYTALTTATDATLQQLTDFLSLPPLPAQVPADASARAIATASVWQARQPVHTRSIGRWKNYAPFVPELEQMFAAT